MSGFNTWGMDDDESKNLGDSTRYKANDGDIDLVSFAYFPITDDGALDFSNAPQWTTAWRHYVQNVGYFLSNGPEWDNLAMQNGSKGKKLAIATVMVVWPTDKDGMLDKKAAFKSNNWTVKSFIVSKDKFKPLKTLHRKWDLAKTDVTIECTEAQYQKMTFSPDKGSVLRKVMADTSDKTQGLRDKLTAAITEAIANLPNDIAQDLTLDSLRERLGMSSGSPVRDAKGTTADDVDDMLEDMIGDDSL